MNPDYIVIGGGSAGAVVASRLSENPAHRVVLLEAGGESRSFFGDMPAGIYKLIGNRKTDWCYQPEPDPTANNRRLHFNAGKMLGGSSAMNGMVYIRGTRADYDRWSAHGCNGWSFAEVLPYFLKSEGWTGAPSQEHGQLGPLTVSPPRSLLPATEDWMHACEQAGVPRMADYCGGDQLGVFHAWVTQQSGQRCSTARGFLEPAKHRSNLRIETHCNVEHLLIEEGRAVGLRYRRDGAMHELRAEREIIVCAGTVGSPALLQRSGIGPGAVLREAGISVLHDLPGVGENLHDHAAVQISKFVKGTTYNVQARGLRLLPPLLNYLLARRGMLTTAVVQAMATFRTMPELQDPDVLLSFLPMAMDWRQKVPQLHARAAVTVAAFLVDPKSRGRVRVRAPEAAVPPVIEHAILEDTRDLEALIRACRLMEAVFAQPAFARIYAGRNHPDAPLETDAEWAGYIRNWVNNGYHPVGTCRMGQDDMPVVDPKLRVHGIAGLRVADASVMPFIPSANTNAPAIMIGERVADFILNG